MTERWWNMIAIMAVVAVVIGIATHSRPTRSPARSVS